VTENAENAAQAALRLDRMIDNTVDDQGTINAQDIMDIETIIYRLRMLESALQFGIVTIGGGSPGINIPPGEYTLVPVVRS